MEIVYGFLTTLHALAAFAGLIVALLAEYGRVRAVADGAIDAHERVYLKRLGRGLVAGALALLVLNPLLASLEYALPHVPQRVLTAAFWFEITLLAFIVVDFWLMARKFIPLWFGGAVSLSAYGMIVLLATRGAGAFGYFELFILYAVAIFITGGLLEYGHILTKRYPLNDIST